jgi:hypothetical protein
MVNQMSIRTYSELIKIPTFEERYRYLRLGGRVGEETFGFDRYLNQKFYNSDEWLNIRDYVIVRDTGNNDYCQDLGMPMGHDIRERILVHHMNPITKEDILRRTKILLDPEYLICTFKSTHDAIHYGDESLLPLTKPIERTRYDTCPWRR